MRPSGHGKRVSTLRYLRGNTHLTTDHPWKKEKSFKQETSLKIPSKTRSLITLILNLPSLHHLTSKRDFCSFFLCFGLFVYFRPNKSSEVERYVGQCNKEAARVKWGRTLRRIRADPIKVSGLLEKGQNVTPSPSRDLKTGRGYSNAVNKSDVPYNIASFFCGLLGQKLADVQHKVHGLWGQNRPVKLNQFMADQHLEDEIFFVIFLPHQSLFSSSDIFKGRD